MKNKAIILLMPLAFLMALAGNVYAKSGKLHKIRTKMTGCLQQGADPNTFVLNDIRKGYTRRNQTGQDPFLLARTDTGIVLVPKGKSKLQNHVGQKVRVHGYFVGERAAAAESTATYSNASSGTTTTTVAPVETAEFRVTKIHKVSGSCP